MPKKKQLIFTTEEDLITFFINRYYQLLEQTPRVRQEEDKHIALIEDINKSYLETFRANDKLEQEKHEGSFIECIDFITKVFTKKRVQEEKEKEMREFMQSLKK